VVLPRTPRLAREDAAKSEAIIIDTQRIAWYRNEDKQIQARSQNSCGLFLDIDGVMHPYGAFGAESFCHMPFLSRIIDETSCDVVLSSSWRLDTEGIQEVNNHLRKSRREANGDAELLDITPNTLERGVINGLHNRDIEVKAWVKAHAEEAGWDNRWIAVDDLNLAGSLGFEHTVVTASDVGLTEAKAEEAIEKLKYLAAEPTH
jgi:hypothetical protein